MSFSSLKQRNPGDFPLYIYIGKGDDKNMRLVAKFSNSAWVPRTDERLVLPIGERDEATEWHLVRVELVVYDFVAQVTNIFCEKLKVGGIRRNTKFVEMLDNL